MTDLATLTIEELTAPHERAKLELQVRWKRADALRNNMERVARSSLLSPEEAAILFSGK